MLSISKLAFVGIASLLLAMVVAFLGAVAYIWYVEHYSYYLESSCNEVNVRCAPVIFVSFYNDFIVSLTVAMVLGATGIVSFIMYDRKVKSNSWKVLTTISASIFSLFVIYYAGFSSWWQMGGPLAIFS
jgi:hypothetical protein